MGAASAHLNRKRGASMYGNKGHDRRPINSTWHYQQRRLRRETQPGHDGFRLHVEKIASRNQLYHCWQELAHKGGDAPGVDGYTYTDFSPSEVGKVVGDLSEQIRAGDYRPLPVRPVQIPKDLGRARLLGLGTLCDRVVGKALDKAFKPLWE